MLFTESLYTEGRRRGYPKDTSAGILAASSFFLLDLLEIIILCGKLPNIVKRNQDCVTFLQFLGCCRASPFVPSRCAQSKCCSACPGTWYLSFCLNGCFGIGNIIWHYDVIIIWHYDVILSSLIMSLRWLLSIYICGFSVLGLQCSCICDARMKEQIDR